MTCRSRTARSTSPPASAPSIMSHGRSSSSPSSPASRLRGMLVVDQIAPIDPLVALRAHRFERARDPSHTRVLADADMRSLLDANGLVLRRSEQRQEARDIDGYLDLAGCAGPPASVRCRSPRGLHGDDRVVPRSTTGAVGLRD